MLGGTSIDVKVESIKKDVFKFPAKGLDIRSTSRTGISPTIIAWSISEIFAH